MNFLGGLVGPSSGGAKVSGYLTAIVTNIDDPEKLGRVKVRILLRDEENYETDWIPVSTMLTGEGFGFYALPAVDDKVIVIFYDGNLEKPCVIANMWYEKRQLPEAVKNAEQPNEVIMLRSAKEQEIIISDNQNNGGITLRTKSGSNITINEGNKKSITIADKDNKNAVEMDLENGNIQISAGNKMVFKVGNTTLTIDSNGVKIEAGNIEIEGKQKSSIKGGTTEVKATGSLTVESNGMAALKGNIVNIN